ncbi:MAG: glycosyltransferase, partial [Haemophilus parainfluenzae]|nr:glycosyltransferase [Haemophilus parainfluenzae]
MNVAFSSDNNYAPYLAVSILSILKNNSKSEICFYILDFGIDNNNKEIIENGLVVFEKNKIVYVGTDVRTEEKLKRSG